MVWQVNKPDGAVTQPRVAPQPRPVPPRQGKRVRSAAVTRGLTPLLLGIVSALIVLPTTIVTMFALLPSLAALVVDEGRPRYLFRTVLGTTLAALWPYLAQLWFGRNDLNAAFAIVSDVYAWAAIYGAAGMGWLIYLSAPAAVILWRQISADREAAALKARQDALAEEWGTALPTVEEETPANPEEATSAG